MALVIPAPATTTIPVAGGGEFPVRRVFCVGRNYADHVREMGGDPDREEPFFFTKPTDAIVRNGAEVRYPTKTKNYHHEIEMVVAIGKGGKSIPVEKALDHVFGYAVGLDMTRRDLQQAAAKAGRPWEIGKSFDQSAPCSAIHPAAKVGHITKGKIQLSVNGQLKQDSDINLMMWDVANIVNHLSAQVTLVPGDLIFTGTPEGVGPVVRGDTMVGSVEGVDTLTIKVG